MKVYIVQDGGRYGFNHIRCVYRDRKKAERVVKRLRTSASEPPVDIVKRTVR